MTCIKRVSFTYFFPFYHYYRPQRSCGQGNVFTGVRLSTGGEGVCLSACWDARPPPGPGRPPWTRQTPPDQADTPLPGSGRSPLDQADPPRIRQTPPDQADHPPDQADPPGKQTPAYGLRAAGTHPTGMHSCHFWNVHHYHFWNVHNIEHHAALRMKTRRERSKIDILIKGQ